LSRRARKNEPDKPEKPGPALPGEADLFARLTSWQRRFRWDKKANLKGFRVRIGEIVIDSPSAHAP